METVPVSGADRTGTEISYKPEEFVDEVINFDDY
jgi:hypothetical protein